MMVAGFFMILPVSGSGVDLYQSGDYAGAIVVFQEDLANNSGPSQAPVLNNIGTSYVSLGDLDNAVLYYQRAIEADPSYDRGWINLGVVQEKLGKTDEAISSYDEVGVTDPAVYAEAKVKKGSLLAAVGRYSDALSSFNLAQSGATGPVVVDLYTGIGAVEFLQNNTAAAEEAFLTATTTDPDGAALAYTNLGVLRIIQGRYDEAQSLFETAIRNDKTGQTKAKSYLEKLKGMTLEGS